MKVIFTRIETFHFHKAFDGGSKLFQYLAEEIVKKGHEVTIVTTTLRDNPKLKEAMHKGVKYVFLPPKYTGERKIKLNMFYKIIYSWNLMKYLEKTDFDVLHNSESFSYFYLHKKNRKKVVYHTHGLEAWGKAPMSQKGIKKLYVKLFLQHPWRYCMNHSDSVTADEEYLIPKIEKLGVPRSKTFWVPDGVNYYEIQKKAKNFKNRRKELGIKKNDFLVISTCRIVHDKGIDDIINGFSMVKKEIPNAKLLMIGSGDLEDFMHDLIKKHKLEKDIIHKKNIPEADMYDYYLSSDLFVSAVISECFFITILEAMACGLPIVSSAQPYIVKNGYNGYVVGFNNPKGIKEAIMKIYSSKKGMKKMGRNSKKKVEQYDYSHVAEGCIKEYKKLLNAKKSFFHKSYKSI